MADSFVSLEQAQEIALENAKNNVAFYEGRWKTVLLAYEVVAAEERQDAYYIRFSYVPAKKFDGQPGEEAYTISKTGDVLSRQILSEPLRHRVGVFGCSLVSLLGIFLVIGAGVSAVL